MAALGLLATAGPRPHITVLCVVSLMIAYMLRRKSWRESKLGPVGKVVGIVVLMGVGAVVVAKAASFFEVDGVSTGSVTEVLDYTDQQSGQGGSEFEAVRVKSPTEFPAAVLAVLALTISGIDAAPTTGLPAPALAALAVLEITWIYNEFFWATVLLQSGDKFPITSSLNNLKGQFFTDYNLLSAGSGIVAIPTLVIFFVLQRHLRAGLTLGATKG